MRIPTEFWIALAIAAYAASPAKYRMKITDFLESLMTHPGICGTRDCRKIAQFYAGSMDRDVDPCVNFYKFSCGSWLGLSDLIPKNGMQVIRLNVLENDIKDLRTAMLGSAIEVTDILPIQQAKRFYQSCMDTDTREARGIRTIASLLESNGGWPMAMNTGDWDENASPWQEVEENFTRMGADHAFHNLNLKIKEIRTRRIHYIILHAPRNDKFPKFRENYTEYQSMLKPIVEAFINENRSNVSTGQLEEDIYDLYIFEKELHGIINLSSALQTSMTDLASFLDFWSVTSTVSSNDRKNEINWHKLFQRLFDIEGDEVDAPWPMSVEDQYYRSFPGILAATDARTIVNYIHWKFVSQTLNYTTEAMRNKLYVFEAGSSTSTRSQQCLQETEMTHAEVYWFAENHFGRDIEKAAQKLAENVKLEVFDGIENSTWLSVFEKAVLKDRLQATKISNGVQDWHRNRTAVELHYRGLIISDDYVTNVLNFRRYQKRYAVRTFVGREEPTRWTKSPLHVGPSYEVDRNFVEIQAAYLQWPSFSIKLPNYINYAATGMVIGHELGHAVERGIIGMNVYGGSNELILEKAKSQFSCIRDYFSNYYTNKTIADQTLSEDICDSIGIRASLDAYNRLRQNEQPYYEELKLPGFEQFTDEQMFFLSFVQVWCGLRTPGSEEHWSDVHSPAEFRVNGGVANTPEFGKAFNCPLGSLMNPAAKCGVWTESLSRSKTLTHRIIIKN